MIAPKRVSIVNRRRLLDRYLTTDSLDEVKSAMIEHTGQAPENFDWWDRLESFWKNSKHPDYRGRFRWLHGPWTITIEDL